MKLIAKSDREYLVAMIEVVFSRMDDGGLFTEMDVALYLVLLVLRGATLAEAKDILDDCLEKAKEADTKTDNHYSGRA